MLFFCFADIFIILKPRKPLKFKMGVVVRDFDIIIGADYSGVSRMYDIKGG